ncbi:heme exporter protein CcmD [Magnetospirillum sp. 64-120]|uniref:heme exporter protein CcmD n=1 Tax=Magnetospirillum sp. 64-120 TaxID=1895778 RepID=UPI000928FE14|nr:heme exporter protein CcmD [Magnetospirillum sp. 64-120]OJX81735.1 MAG: heme exporter protein CcmD [Magnetospirillum sp. 64-120]
MDNLSAFFAMGGYAGYVWPTYILAVVVMAVLLIASVRSAHANERDLEAAQSLRPSRRRRNNPSAASAEPGAEEVPQA